MDLYNVLTALVRHSIPKIREEDLLAVLRKRAHPHGDAEGSILQHESVQGCFEGTDAEDVERHVQAGRSSAEVAFGAKVQEATAAYHRKVAGKRGAKNPPSAAKARGWKEVPKVLSQQDASTLLPPHQQCTIWRDERCCRWQARFTGFGSLSRSWQLYGEVRSAVMRVKWCWDRFRALTGDDGIRPPYDWVEQASDERFL